MNIQMGSRGPRYGIGLELGLGLRGLGPYKYRCIMF